MNHYLHCSQLPNKTRLAVANVSATKQFANTKTISEWIEFLKRHNCYSSEIHTELFVLIINGK